MSSKPNHLRVELRTDPRGIDSTHPEFSWRWGGDAVVAPQDAYEIEVRRSGGGAADDRVWSSGMVDSERPYGVRYSGPPLTSATSYSWRVRLRADGAVSEWSDAATFETGLLSASDWSAEWIAEPPRSKGSDRRTQYFRREIQVAAPVRRARAYVSALGWYRLYINGTDQTGPDLVPRWTSLDDIVEYQVYDVTDSLVEGSNVLGVVVAEGRYRGALGTFNKIETYGDRLATIVQVEIEYADGTTRTVGSDTSWTVGTGRILIADPKWGERIDAGVPEIDWNASDDPQGFGPAHPLPRHSRRLVAEEVERVTRVGTYAATISTTPSGAQLLDFGQNFNGYASIRLTGTAGSTVVVRYSEVLTPEGELEMDYLEYASSKDWFQRDEIILGDEEFEYTPSFTIRGFRYVTVEGLDVDLADDDVVGIEISTPLAVTGEFHASDPRLEQMARTTMASLRANFSDTATDCPTRERTGWTGDVQVFAPTAAIMVDSDAFLRRYLRNLALEQDPDGRVPNWIPSETSDFSWSVRDRALKFVRSSVGWGDAAVLVPWTLYQYYGDEEVLRRQWHSAKAWVEQLERRARRSGLSRRFGARVGALEKYIVDTGYHYGEWLRPGENASGTFRDNVLRPPAALATAYYALSSGVLAQIADVLGDRVEAVRWKRVSSRAREAWRAAFVTDGGRRIGDDRQDDYVRALTFDLLPPGHRAAAASRLAELVVEAGDHLGTGFLSTPLLLQALSENGHADVAYRVLLQETAPSWLGQLDRGATTWWETWEGYEDNGHAKVSHDHYTFGSVTRWLHEHVAGLRPLEPGYRRFLVAPVIGGGLTSASSAVETPFGRAAASWRLDDSGVIHLTVMVPPGTTATIRLVGREKELAAGTHQSEFHGEA
ncbi:family 78 glycoside hydrolase catalytic domain [Microbacterium sp.]|uniref:family 78 glycoside hydrolase catalytic domain n=1 Tax=Microbacterium sp. TaxID=51671 RepID=UPI00289D9907|nr:family 78 glycoside hydrolase catalytic domain [Microbacterium sp.]